MDLYAAGRQPPYGFGCQGEQWQYQEYPPEYTPFVHSGALWDTQGEEETEEW